MYGGILSLTHSHLYHYWHIPTMVGFCHGENMMGNRHNRSCVIQNERAAYLTLVSLTRPGALALASRGWVMSELWRLYQTQFTWNWRWKCISSGGNRPTMVVMKILFFSQLAHQRLGLGQWEYFLPRRHLPSLLEIKNFTFPEKKHQFWIFQQSMQQMYGTDISKDI